MSHIPVRFHFDGNLSAPKNFHHREQFLWLALHGASTLRTFLWRFETCVRQKSFKSLIAFFSCNKRMERSKIMNCWNLRFRIRWPIGKDGITTGPTDKLFTWQLVASTNIIVEGNLAFSSHQEHSSCRCASFTWFGVRDFETLCFDE